MAAHATVRVVGELVGLLAASAERRVDVLHALLSLGEQLLPLGATVALTVSDAHERALDLALAEEVLDRQDRTPQVLAGLLEGAVQTSFLHVQLQILDGLAPHAPERPVNGLRQRGRDGLGAHEVIGAIVALQQAVALRQEATQVLHGLFEHLALPRDLAQQDECVPLEVGRDLEDFGQPRLVQGDGGLEELSRVRAFGGGKHQHVLQDLDLDLVDGLAHLLGQPPAGPLEAPAIALAEEIASHPVEKHPVLGEEGEQLLLLAVLDVVAAALPVLLVDRGPQRVVRAAEAMVTLLLPVEVQERASVEALHVVQADDASAVQDLVDLCGVDLDVSVLEMNGEASGLGDHGCLLSAAEDYPKTWLKSMISVRDIIVGVITFKNVSKLYKPDTKALDGISFHVAPGEFVSIVGTSGSGKTTLAKLLFAEEKPTGGSIHVGDWDISKIRRAEIPALRRQIGVVFQDYKLLPKKTAYENAAFALEVAGASGARIREVVPQVLKIVGLADKMHRYPRQLSGGEQQRVSIARALVHRPKIILADEPTGNLDAITSREIVELLKRINDVGTTVILVTHDRDIVNAMRRRVITIQQGKIVSDAEHGKYHLG